MPRDRDACLRDVRVAGFCQGNTRRADETAHAASGTLCLAMLERFILDTFTPRVGEPFRLHVQGVEPTDFVLESVNAIPVSGWRPDDVAEHRQPFSLVFLGPPTFVLPQAIYRFEHDSIGTFEIFIVPIGRTDQGVSYEAVFS
jgi:hypothetical protein